MHQGNTYDGPTVAFKGMKTVDVAKSMAFLQLLPPGVVLPDIAQQALGQIPETGKTEVYT